MERDAKKRIVITGLGTVNPLGNNVEQTWQAISEGRSGINRMDPLVNTKVHIAGEVKGFEPLNYFEKRELRGIHRVAQFAHVSTLQALVDAGLWEDGHLKNIDPDEIGLRIGSGVGGMTVVPETEMIIQQRGDRRIPPLTMLLLLAERVSSVPSIKLGLRGPVSSTVAACATGSVSIIDAMYAIKMGDAQVMVAGGSESALDKVGVGSFAALTALSTRNDEPEKASRPFDKGADGFVMSEGSGVVVVESLSHALARNAKIYAEIVGYSNTADAYHETAPHGSGAIRAMRQSIVRAGIQSKDIDYINAHGTSTQVGDAKELQAILEVFGVDERAQGNQLLVSSTKSMVGHLLGAAGGFEALMCAKAIETGVIPPTINQEQPIRDEIDLVPNISRQKEITYAMSNSFGFGGLNSVLVMKKYCP